MVYCHGTDPHPAKQSQPERKKRSTIKQILLKLTGDEEKKLFILNSNLYFENHISHVTRTAFFHLRNIAKLRNMLTVSDAEKLVPVFMTSRLDYCNALLGGCPTSSINKLQIVHNVAAKALIRSRKYDHIIPILQSLRWLPIKFCMSYKIVLLQDLRFYSSHTQL